MIDSKSFSPFIKHYISKMYKRQYFQVKRIGERKMFDP